MDEDIVQIAALSHSYGQRKALDEINLKVRPAEIFGFLGPNGSGKTTLFRILSTLIPPQTGELRIAGMDVRTQRDAIRRIIGVVFQAPSLDKQLTAEENLRHHGHLYGLRGAELRARIEELLAAVGIAQRARERVGTFSGGMRRRVELAKGMLTRPRLLLLDEPSTGLDPGARIDLWDYLRRVGRDLGVTVLLTTHLMDEADRCDRLAILESGRLLACDSPAAMKAAIGGDVISLRIADPDAARKILRERLDLHAEVIDDALRLERPDAHALIPRIVEALPAGAIESISVSKPTLEDAFVKMTGRHFRDETAAGAR